MPATVVSARRRATRIVRRGWHELRGQLDQLPYRARLRSSRQLHLPKFLGIGAQKAGTTWLHANLSHHPDLFLPVEKEIHYFDWFEQTSVRRYAEVFDDAQGRMAGDISPGYSAMSIRRVRMVRRLVPEAKILLLLRDPVERAWSQVLMALRRQGRDSATISVEELLSYVGSRGARRRGEYVRTIVDWSEVFGEDSLWVGFYDDIAAAPVPLLTDVFEHLGVDLPEDWSGFPIDTRFNPGSGIEPPPAIRAALVEHFRPELEALDRLYPDRVARWRADQVRDDIAP